MPPVDVLFPASGTDLPTDHAYPLYAALFGLVPGVKRADGPRFAPLTGRPSGPGRLALTDWSVLRVRVSSDRVGEVLPLAGRRLEVAGAAVRLGVPSVSTLEPAARLFAPVVIVKPNLELPRPPKGERPKVVIEPESFTTIVRRKLSLLGVTGEVSIRYRLGGKRGPELCRRVVRVKGKRLVGYAVEVSGLSAADSLTLQAAGLGGRTRIGCGFFVPKREGT